MPRTPVPVTEIDLTGAPNLGAGGTEIQDANGASNGYEFDQSDEVILLVRNADVSSHNITFLFAPTFAGQSVNPLTVAIAAGKQVPFKKFNGYMFRQASGKVWFTCDSTQLKMQAIK